MHQKQLAGENLLVDYPGKTVSAIGLHTGDIHQTQIFVAILGANSFIFAEAT